MQDYNYITGGCMELTLEISCCKYPAPSTLPTFWLQNRDPLVNLLAQAHIGVKGIVTDANNNPVEGALIEIVGRDHPTSTSKQGEFWRLLLPGPYTLRVIKAGFANAGKTFTVSDSGPTRVDVSLTPGKAVFSSANPNHNSGKLLNTILVRPKYRDTLWPQNHHEQGDNSLYSGDPRPSGYGVIGQRLQGVRGQRSASANDILTGFTTSHSGWNVEGQGLGEVIGQRSGVNYHVLLRPGERARARVGLGQSNSGPGILRSQAGYRLYPGSGHGLFRSGQHWAGWFGLTGRLDQSYTGVHQQAEPLTNAIHTLATPARPLLYNYSTRWTPYYWQKAR